MPKNNTSNSNSSTENYPAKYRLPCRGCRDNCENYHHCNGKLWRMGDSLSMDTNTNSVGNIGAE